MDPGVDSRQNWTILEKTQQLITVCHSARFSLFDSTRRYVDIWPTHLSSIFSFTVIAHVMCDYRVSSGAPNDCFLSNAFKRCFRLSGVLLKLCRLILGCAENILSVRLF